jgi:hypothetical protein
VPDGSNVPNMPTASAGKVVAVVVSVTHGPLKNVLVSFVVWKTASRATPTVSLLAASGSAHPTRNAITAERHSARRARLKSPMNFVAIILSPEPAVHLPQQGARRNVASSGEDARGPIPAAFRGPDGAQLQDKFRGSKRTHIGA